MFYFIWFVKFISTTKLLVEMEYSGAIGFDKNVYQNLKKTLFFIYNDKIFEPALKEIEEKLKVLCKEAIKDKNNLERYIIGQFIRTIKSNRTKITVYELFKHFNTMTIDILEKQSSLDFTGDLFIKKDFDNYCFAIIKKIEGAQKAMTSSFCHFDIFHFTGKRKSRIETLIPFLDIKDSKLELRKYILSSLLDDSIETCMISSLNPGDIGLTGQIVDYFIKAKLNSKFGTIYICLDFNIYLLNILLTIVFDTDVNKKCIFGYRINNILIEHFNKDYNDHIKNIILNYSEKISNTRREKIINMHIENIHNEFDIASNKLENFSFCDLDIDTINKLQIKSPHLKWEIYDFDLSISDLNTTITLLFNNFLQIESFDIELLISKSQAKIDKLQDSLKIFLSKLIEIQN